MSKQITDKEYRDVLKYIENDEFLKLSYIDKNNIDDIIAVKNTLRYQMWELKNAWIELGKVIMETKEVKNWNKCIACFKK